MVYKISWDSGRLPWQPNLGKKCTHHFFADIEKFFAYMVGISGLVNFNTLSEFLRGLMELPWQPNLGKKCTHQFPARNREIFRMYSWDFGTGESQYAIKI